VYKPVPVNANAGTSHPLDFVETKVTQAGAKGKLMRFLCVFGIPRTGSSHLNRLFRSCPEFSAKSELFHRRANGRLSQGELAAMRERSAGAVTDIASFVAWRRQHPLDTLEALHAGSGGRVVTFKAFPGHVPRALLESELFPRDDVGFAVLRRRPIESYISGLKAKSISRFGRIDTTEMKPSLSADEFVAWAKRMKGWYGYTREKLEARGAPYARISYEKHLDGRSDSEALGAVLELIEPLGFAGITVPRNVAGHERQDRERRYQDRVGNWDAFAEAMRSDARRAQLLRWAERMPWTKE
jgi:hypothetical protein